jgi:phosphoglycolate phosphatase-like HAD superfamily hydrolase
MHVRSVIGFDFDQTLADSARGIHDCLLYIGQSFGIKVDEDSVAKIARSGLKLDPMLLELIPDSLLSQARQIFLSIYPEIGVAGTRPLSGASDLLQMLRDNGHRLAVISAKSLRNLELSLKHLDFKFDEVYGDASGQEKTECILKSKAQIYIGDQESDVIAARNAGVTPILVNNVAPAFDLSKYEFHYFENLPLLATSLNGIIELQSAR